MSFARWLSAAENTLGSIKQVAVLGEAGEESFERMLKVVRAKYRPNVITAASPYPLPKDVPTLLNNRPLLNGKATTYVCEGFICKQPVTDPEALAKMMGEE
jgi:uncharacterized protein YyaL (SSP411 family)